MDDSDLDPTYSPPLDGDVPVGPAVMEREESSGPTGTGSSSHQDQAGPEQSCVPSNFSATTNKSKAERKQQLPASSTLKNKDERYEWLKINQPDKLQLTAAQKERRNARRRLQRKLKSNK